MKEPPCTFKNNFEQRKLHPSEQFISGVTVRVLSLSQMVDGRIKLQRWIWYYRVAKHFWSYMISASKYFTFFAKLNWGDASSTSQWQLQRHDELFPIMNIKRNQLFYTTNLKVVEALIFSQNRSNNVHYQSQSFEKTRFRALKTAFKIA